MGIFSLGLKWNDTFSYDFAGWSRSLERIKYIRTEKYQGHPVLRAGPCRPGSPPYAPD
jgi:hypothetical protein